MLGERKEPLRKTRDVGSKRKETKMSTTMELTERRIGADDDFLKSSIAHKIDQIVLSNEA